MLGQAFDIEVIRRSITLPEDHRVLYDEAPLNLFLVAAATPQDIFALPRFGADIQSTEAVNQGFGGVIAAQSVLTPLEDFRYLQEGTSLPVHLHPVGLAVEGQRAITQAIADGIDQLPARCQGACPLMFVRRDALTIDCLLCERLKGLSRGWW